MRRRNKKTKQEKRIKDFGYDGYYNDVKPEDVGEYQNNKAENEKTAIKVSALIFGTLVIIAFIVVFMVAF